MELNGDTGARADRFSIKDKDFVQMPIPLPNLEEQSKIARFLESVDNLIAANQRKVHDLKQIKTAYLERIFNQTLRFSSSTSPWVQRKVKSVFEERSERSGVGEMISVTINHGVVPASSLDRKDNSSEDRSNYKVVKQGDIAYNSMRMWQGASGVSRYEGIVSPAYTILKPIEGANSNFFGYLFKTNKMIQTFQKHSQGLTSDTWNLKYPALSEIQISYPDSGDEQATVAKLFEALDNLIAANQRKVDLLQKQKTSYLQRMFI